MDSEVETVSALQPDAGGWIQWNGGPCPVIGMEQGSVEGMYRNGSTAIFNDTGYYSDNDLWSHDDYYLDIIAYRIHKP